MKTFLDRAVMQHHPLRVLETFLAQEQANEQAQKYEEMRFVGYVLDIGYETITIITSDPFKIAVGGIPRNSLLIMVPASFERLPLHFTLLRVLESAPSPLSKEVQQTYFELQKKSMPELDVFTQSELQWGALTTGVLGMFYANPDRLNTVEFSGDLNNFVSAHKYRLYAPDDALLDLIVNSMVPEENRFVLGDLRLTECRLPLPDRPQPQVKASVSTTDFMGTRTAMFGKTRLGKSNVVKLVAQSLLETTVQARNVGQLIFDINGEYANDNPQDGKRSLRSGFADRCEVYAFTQRPNTPSKPLKLNFYEHPESALPILGSLLKEDNKVSTYIQAFTSVELPSLEELASLPPNGGDLARPLRKMQIFWAILKKAGYQADETKLRELAPTGSPASKFNPGFSRELRTTAYQASDPRLTTLPPAPVRHISVPGMRNYDAIRQIVFDSLKDPSLEGEPLETLKWLIYEKWSEHGRNLAPFQCPHCELEVAVLPYDADEGICPNPACKGKLFVTDFLGFHQEMAPDSAPDSIATSYMMVHETLLLFTAVRYFWQHQRQVLSTCLFIKDGPLSIYSQYAKLVDPIRRFLAFAREDGWPIYMLGQEKTGRFADHLQLIGQRAPAGSIFIPDSTYITEQIQHRFSRGKTYGEDTNYGAKVFVKLNEYHRMVLSIPTGKYVANPTYADLIGADTIFTTLPTILSNRYEGALLPIELAHNVASLSSYPSAPILKMFAERARKGQLGPVE